MKKGNALILRREISAIIWGTDQRDASFVADKIVDLLIEKGMIDGTE
jgi:hypothetical protein